MEKTKQILALEQAYDQPIEALLREKYRDDQLSQRELADELGVPRSTLQYWLREAGVEMRRRTLTDVQRITILALLPYLPNHRIAERVGCSKITVARYRRELQGLDTDDDLPVDLSVELTQRDRTLLLPDTAAQWVRDANATADDADADEADT